MNYFTISAKLIEVNEKVYTYTYAIDDLDMRDENIGIFTMEEDVFYNIPDDLNFISNMTLKQIIDGKIKQIKPCSEAVLPEDEDIDLNIIFVSSLLVKSRIENNEIPESIEVLNAARMLEILEDEEERKIIVESGKLTKKDLDSLTKAIKALPEMQDNCKN